jgi:hypothetical protein
MNPGHCIDCRPNKRCPAHLRASHARHLARRERRRNPTTDRERHDAVIGAHVEVHGWQCPGLPPTHPPHPCLDLVAVPTTDDDGEELHVLCKPINASRGVS